MALSGQAALDYINQHQNNIVQPQQPNMIQSIVGGIFEPVENILRGSAQQIADITNDQSKVYLEGNKLKELRENPLAFYGKSGAGVASMLIPGASIPRLAASGVLAGIGQSAGEDLDTTLQNALIGGVASPVAGKLIQGGGKLIKGLGKGASKGASNLADNMELGGIKSAYGYKIPDSMGGSELLKNTLKYGHRFNSADEIMTSAQGMVDDYFNQARNMVQQGVQKGIKASPKEFVQPLLNKLKDSKISELEKAPLRKVLDTFVQDIGGKITKKGYQMPKSIPLDELLGKSQAYGQYGKWSKLGLTDDVTNAKAYEDLYKLMREEVSNKLEQAGIKGFRDVNKVISDNIDIIGAARKGVLRDQPTLPITLADLTASIGGGVAGGPIGAMAGYAAKRIANSPQAQNATVKGLRGLGSLPELTSNIQIPQGIKATMGKLPIVAPQVLNDFMDMPSGMSLPNQSPQLLLGNASEGQDMSSSFNEYQSLRQQAAMELLSMTDAKGNALFTPTEALKEADAVLQINYGISPEMLGAGSSNDLTADQRNKISNVNSSLTALDRLEQAYNQFGTDLPFVGSVLNANPFDAQRQGFEMQLATTNQIIAKALESGKMTDADRIFYMSKLPKSGDSKATAIEKIRLLKQAMREELRNYQSPSLVGLGGM